MPAGFNARFFALRFPVIIVLAYFVVQWQVSLLPKLLVVMLGAFAISVGLYQFIVRRVPPLRVIYGMKA